jgi:radical SAM protein with 4Fe4S-binding SPASM domain
MSQVFWNMYAFPVELGSNKFVFLTDQKSVLKVDEEIYQLIKKAPASDRKIGDAISTTQLSALSAVKLVTTENTQEQFQRVFGASMAPAKYELLHVITSYSCNLACSYCFMLTDLAEHPTKVLSSDVVRKGVDLFFSLPHKEDAVIHFYGGEPLLHTDLIRDCLEYTYTNYSRQVAPKIITNGTLFGSDVLSLLKEYPFDLSVSLDGDSEANDVYRIDHKGNSTFNKVVEGIRTFQAEGHNPKILITVGTHNIKRLTEIVEFVLSLKPKAIALNFPRALTQTDHCLDDPESTSTYWVEQYEKCLELCFEHRIAELYFADMLFAFLSGKPSLRPCAACGSQISIGPGGVVGPCQAFVAAGKFMTPITRFKSEEPNNPFKIWKDVSKASSNKCSKCYISPVCGGDCNFDRYNRTGSLHEPLPFHCDLRVAMANALANRIIAGKSLGFGTDFYV